MTVNHSKDWWVATDDETYYGGGTGGVAYAKTAPAQGDLNAFPFPMEGQDLPYVEYLYEEVRAAGMDAKQLVRFLKDKVYNDAKYKHYFHNTTYLAKVIANCARSGQLPTGTMVHHWESPIAQVDAFGVWTKEYILEMKVEEYVSETETYSFYDIASGSDLVQIDFPDSNPIGFNRFHFGGYNEVHCSSDGATGLTAATKYYFKANGKEYELTGVGSGGTDTFNALIAAMNLAYEVKSAGPPVTLMTTKLPTDLVFSHNGAAQGAGGYLRCTGSISCVKLAAGTSGTDLFATLTGYQHIHTPEVDTLDVTAFSVTVKLETQKDQGKAAGCFERKYPYIQKVSVSGSMTFKMQQSTLLGITGDTRSTTAKRNDIAVWIDADQDDVQDANEFLVLHNICLLPGKTTAEKLPDFGIKEYTLDFEMGQNFDILRV